MNHQTSASNEVHETTEAIPDTDSLSSSDSESSSDSSDSEESSESGCDEWPEIDRKQLLEDLRREHSDLTVLEKTRREGESDRKSPYYKQRVLVLWLLYFLCLWKSLNMVSNNALNSMLIFLFNFFKLLSYEDPYVAAMLTVFPTSLYLARKMLGIDRDNFEHYVVCPSCYHLYRLSECLKEDARGNMQPEKCSHVSCKKGKYSKKCNSTLFKRVILKNGKAAYYPLKVYCYRHVTTSLECMLLRDGFEDMCEEWRGRISETGVYSDVYDGIVWKDFGRKNNRLLECSK